MRNTLITLAVLVILVAGLGYWWQRVHKQNPQQTPGQQVTYLCREGKTITANYHNGQPAAATNSGMPQPTGSVDIVLSDGRSLTLSQTVSASGIRYANADGSLIFWSKGNGAFTMENNKEVFQDCIALGANPQGFTQAYADPTSGFSIQYPDGYKVNSEYKYQNLGPGKEIYGSSFAIPASLAQGTNLNPDTYLSVEEIPRATTCSAAMFLYGTTTPQMVQDGDMEYSVASSTGAAAGNRYNERVYAIPGTNPCIAVRYFEHYGVLENYPPGTVKQFDEAALLNQFDAIRRTLVINQ